MFKKEVLVPNNDTRLSSLAELIDKKFKLSEKDPSQSSARHHKQFVSDLVRVSVFR